MTNALPIETSSPDDEARRFHHLVPRRIAQGALGVFMGSGSDDKKQGTNTSEPRESDGGPDASRNKSSVPPFSRREKHAGAVVGAIAGAVVGAFAGPPGLIAGSALGAAMGAVAGAALDRIDAERDRRDRELDDEIGITRGNMGAYPVTMRPPAAPRESMLDMLSGDLASSPNLFEAPASSPDPASPLRPLAVEELRFDVPATEADDRATVEERDRLTSAESPLAMLARAAAQDVELEALARPSSAATVAVAVAVPPAALPPVESSPPVVPEDAPSSTTAVTLSLGAPSSDAVVDGAAPGDAFEAPSSTTAVAAPIATLAPEAPTADEGDALAGDALAAKSGEHEAELAAASTRPSGSVPVATTSVVPPSGDVAKVDVPDDVELPRASQA